jgi:site-specific DNA recombinase
MRCAIYIRVSTDRDEQKASLKYQKELFYRHITGKGWDFYRFMWMSRQELREKEKTFRK